MPFLSISQQSEAARKQRILTPDNLINLNETEAVASLLVTSSTHVEVQRDVSYNESISARIV